MSSAIGYFLRWLIADRWDIMALETTQRHLQMLLIVSSFGESRRWVNHSAAALLNLKTGGGNRRDYFLAEGIVGLLTGKTMKKVLPCPKFDSTQMRPWCASTMLLTIASPKPDPSCLSMLCPR